MASDPLHPLGVVHLIRRQNGVPVAERFFHSYDRNPAGADHGLILIFKGFEGRVDPEYDRVLSGRQYHSLFVPDRGFDIEPYYLAAQAFPCEHFCFLNSFSQFLDRDWLAKLYAAAGGASVGAASATGSWGTFYSHRKGERKQAWAEIRRRHGRAWFAAAKEIGLWAARDVKYAILFPDFPGPHLRTNALVMSRENVLATWKGVSIPSKMAAWRFEHGRNSMTRKLARRGLRVVVVGKDGRSYAQDEWIDSKTFWRGDQENLLVSDNQTERYARGDDATRSRLSEGAWGRQFSRPAKPGATHV
jgi:hypothetical protein